MDGWMDGWMDVCGFIQYMCAYAWLDVCMHASMFVYMYIYIYLFVNVSALSIYIYMCVCVCVCICVCICEEYISSPTLKYRLFTFVYTRCCGVYM